MASVALPPCAHHSRHSALVSAPPVTPLLSLTSCRPCAQASLPVCCLRCTASIRPHAIDPRIGTSAVARGRLHAAAGVSGAKHRWHCLQLPGSIGGGAALEGAQHTRGPRGLARPVALERPSTRRRLTVLNLHRAHPLHSRCRPRTLVRASPQPAPSTTRLRRTVLGRQPAQRLRCAVLAAAASPRGDLLAQPWRAPESDKAQGADVSASRGDGRGTGFWPGDDAGGARWSGGDGSRGDQRRGWQVEEQRSAEQSTAVDGGKSEAEKEEQRRGRISKANKGKVPWNKGRQWSEEVRAKIRERTKQAMSNPKVRERLRDHGHTQSEETRSLIRERMRAAWQRKRQQREAALALLAEWRAELAAAARVGLAGDRELVRCGNGRILYADEALERALGKHRRQAAREAAAEEGEKQGRGARANKERGNGGGRVRDGDGGEGEGEKPAKVLRGEQSEEHRRRISQAIKAKWADPAYRSNVARGMKSGQRVQSPAGSTPPAPAKRRANSGRRSARVTEKERQSKRGSAAPAVVAVEGMEGGGEGVEGAAGRGGEEEEVEAVVVRNPDEAFVQAVMAGEAADAEARGGEAEQSAGEGEGAVAGVRFKRVVIVRQTEGGEGEGEARAASGEHESGAAREFQWSDGASVRMGGAIAGALHVGEYEGEAVHVVEVGHGEEDDEEEDENMEAEGDVDEFRTAGEGEGKSDWRRAIESVYDGAVDTDRTGGAMHDGVGTANGAPHEHESLPSLQPLASTTQQRRLARQLIARRRKQLAERARVLMQEAQRAARSLEAVAGRDATAMASLLETRRLLDQARRAVTRAERGAQHGRTGHTQEVTAGVMAGEWSGGLASAPGDTEARWAYAVAPPSALCEPTTGWTGGQGHQHGERRQEQGGAGEETVQAVACNGAVRTVGPLAAARSGVEGTAGVHDSAGKGAHEAAECTAGTDVGWREMNGAVASADDAVGLGDRGGLEVVAQVGEGEDEMVENRDVGGEESWREKLGRDELSDGEGVGGEAWTGDTSGSEASDGEESGCMNAQDMTGAMHAHSLPSPCTAAHTSDELLCETASPHPSTMLPVAAASTHLPVPQSTLPPPAPLPHLLPLPTHHSHPALPLAPPHPTPAMLPAAPTAAAALPCGHGRGRRAAEGEGHSDTLGQGADGKCEEQERRVRGRQRGGSGAKQWVGGRLVPVEDAYKGPRGQVVKN